MSSGVWSEDFGFVLVGPRSIAALRSYHPRRRRTPRIPTRPLVTHPFPLTHQSTSLKRPSKEVSELLVLTHTEITEVLFYSVLVGVRTLWKSPVNQEIVNASVNTFPDALCGFYLVGTRDDRSSNISFLSMKCRVSDFKVFSFTGNTVN